MEHPIGSMMQATMENLKDMVDVNTVIGDAVQTGDGSTIIPVSKVCFGFVAGGGEYGKDERGRLRPPVQPEENLPFAGGSGAGVSVQPVGFLVVDKGSVRMLAAQCSTVADKVVELLPQVVEDVKDMLGKKGTGKGVFTTSQPPFQDALNMSRMNKGEPHEKEETLS